MNALVSRRIVSLLRGTGALEVFIEERPVPAPGDNELLVRVEAAPINPADVKLLFCSVPPECLTVTGEGVSAMVRGQVALAQMGGLAARVDVPLAIGNEGAGLVVAAGRSATTRGLIGKRVAVAAGGMFAPYRNVPVADVIVLPDDILPDSGAAAWINPLTALAMVETMKREGHRAMVLTAAASNLGQMLNRLCLADGIPLVNIVRSDRQADMLRGLGAAYVCNSAAPDFEAQLVEALIATGATIAFDATGGGSLAGRILHAMEVALAHAGKGYSRYGSSDHKQLYFFGGLDPAPVMFERNFGMSWGIGGWLLQSVLARLGNDAVAMMKQRITQELHGIFASSYAQSISLAGMLAQENWRAYTRLATGSKFLVEPQRA